LFRHYWVLFKLLINALATILLRFHTQRTGILARSPQETIFSGGNVGRLQIQLVADVAAAILLMLVVTTLSVYKLRSMTTDGAGKQHKQRGLARL